MFTLRAIPNLAPPLPTDLWDAGRQSTLSKGHSRAQHAVLTAQRMLDGAERDPAARQPQIDEAALIRGREQRMDMMLTALRETGLDTQIPQPAGTASPTRDSIGHTSSRGPEAELRASHVQDPRSAAVPVDEESGTSSSNMSDVSTSSGLTGIEM